MNLALFPPRISLALTVLLLAGTLFIGVTHSLNLIKFPLVAAWLILSVLGGVGLIWLNGTGLTLRQAWPWFGFGVLATVAGFSLQSVVNGMLVSRLGDPTIPLHALLLGFGSGFCQTLGKLALFWIAWRWFGASAKPGVALAAGLGVGLGFGITEVLFIGWQLILTAAPVDSLLGVLERIIAVGFHLFSGGLIAVAFLHRTWWPVALILLIHTLMDTASVALAHVLSILWLEGIFFILAAIVYVVWLIVTRPMKNGPKAIP